MMQDSRVKRVLFIDLETKKSFDALKCGKFEDLKLHGAISVTIDKLKGNPFCGTQIPKKLWPRRYVKKYGINNLWKYNLPDGWRMIYTIKGSELSIISVIIEWFSHKDYEKRFGYV